MSTPVFGSWAAPLLAAWSLRTGSSGSGVAEPLGVAGSDPDDSADAVASAAGSSVVDSVGASARSAGVWRPRPHCWQPRSQQR